MLYVTSWVVFNCCLVFFCCLLEKSSDLRPLKAVPLLPCSLWKRDLLSELVSVHPVCLQLDYGKTHSSDEYPVLTVNMSVFSWSWNAALGQVLQLKFPIQTESNTLIYNYILISGSAEKITLFIYPICLLVYFYGSSGRRTQIIYLKITTGNTSTIPAIRERILKYSITCSNYTTVLCRILILNSIHPMVVKIF